MTEEEIKMAAKIGAEAGIAAYNNERQLHLKRASDRRFRNTEMLLKNYRDFKRASQEAVFRVEDCESLENIILDLMMPGNVIDVTVQSIQQSAARTITIVQHIEKMVALYQQFCFTNGDDVDKRRWHVIDGLYLQEQSQSIAELAEQLHVTTRQIYDDRRDAIERISVYMFGVDFVAYQ